MRWPSVWKKPTPLEVLLTGKSSVNRNADSCSMNSRFIWNSTLNEIGEGVDHTKVVIWDDMLVIRERFLTDPERYIVETPAGKDVVRAARMQVAKQHSIDNVPYFEEVLQAKAIHQVYDVEPENDFWMHVVIFDRKLTE